MPARKIRYKLYVRGTSYFHPSPDKVIDACYGDYKTIDDLMRQAKRYIKYDNVFDVAYLDLKTGDIINLKGQYL